MRRALALFAALLLVGCGSDVAPSPSPVILPVIAPTATTEAPTQVPTAPPTVAPTPDAAATAGAQRQAVAESARATMVAGVLATATANAPTETPVLAPVRTAGERSYLRAIGDQAVQLHGLTDTLAAQLRELAGITTDAQWSAWTDRNAVTTQALSTLLRQMKALSAPASLQTVQDHWAAAAKHYETVVAALSMGVLMVSGDLSMMVAAMRTATPEMDAAKAEVTETNRLVGEFDAAHRP